MLPQGGLPEYFDRAKALIEEFAANPPDPLGLPETNADFEHLRWFPYPDECLTS